MNNITDHRFPGDDLNDSIIIEVDARDPRNGNASHKYILVLENPATPPHAAAEISFQHGARDEEGSDPGITDAALVAVLLDRYRGFQSGPFACRDNALVITHLEDALMRMQRRVKDRLTRGVLGKNEE